MADGTARRPRQPWQQAAALLALASAALFAAVVWWHVPPASALHGYLLALAVLGLWQFQRAIGRALPPASDHGFAQALRRPRATPVRPAELERTAALVRFAISSNMDLHYRLRPLLRELAAYRLATRRGIALDSQPEQARTALGASDAALWELLRPDRLPPRERTRGLDAAALERVLDMLERV